MVKGPFLAFTVSVGKPALLTWNRANGSASDNALEFEVVLENGRHVTANSRKNSDLFWALKGGGPGTYGVVTSVALKTHDRVPVTGEPLSNQPL